MMNAFILYVDPVKRRKINLGLMNNYVKYILKNVAYIKDLFISQLLIMKSQIKL